MRRKVTQKKLFPGTRALVMGLGLHGGGVATVKWLVGHGAKVTATDKRSKTTLAPSVHALEGFPVRYRLGAHHHEDFRKHDLIVVNPGVPRESEFVQTAVRAGKRIENDASLFFRYNERPVIAVTGTRGKTTTTLWIAELLAKKFPKVAPCGNTPENAFLKEYGRVRDRETPVVAEMSSWQLEHLPSSERAPQVSVVTNLYPDHLNRYKGMKDYARAKANIFLGQKSGDILILNADNEWTSHFLSLKPKAQIFFVSRKVLPAKQLGLFVRAGKLTFRSQGGEEALFPIDKFVALRGAHNLENLMHAVLATKLFAPSLRVTLRDALALPTPRMRQEVLYQKGRLAVVNDSCATSPDGTIAAIERFRKGGHIVLIAGGTDKELEFLSLAKTIANTISTQQLILLEGSATTKLLHELVRHPKMSRSDLDKNVGKNLEECLQRAFTVAKTLKGKTTILFSPGAASFEKFLHEFDRGEQFNKLVKKYEKISHEERWRT